MLVDHDAARAALDAIDWKLDRFPKCVVFLSEPEDGLSNLTVEGSAHVEEIDVVTALGLAPGPPIKRYTPTTAGYVASEAHRQPSAGAVAVKSKPRKKAPKPDPDVVEANVRPEKRARTSRRRK